MRTDRFTNEKEKKGDGHSHLKKLNFLQPQMKKLNMKVVDPEKI
jgi:hypothetical protein